MKKSLVRCVLVALVVGISIVSPVSATRLKSIALNPATDAAPPADLWREIDEASLGSAKDADRQIVPQLYRVFELDEASLAETLDRAPLEFSAAAKTGAPVVMNLPMPDGSMQRFRIQESPVMEPALAARRPDLRTFIAQGIDDPAAAMRFDRTPAGFHAMVLSPNGTVFVDPYRKNDTRTYISYYKRDYVRDTGWRCDTVDDPIDSAASKLGDTRVPSGSNLRTYRLALACTGEYAAFHGGTVPLVETEYVTLVNRLNSVYEVDLAVRMVLVANNSSVIFTNSATDPYTNSNGSTMLGQNQTTCTNVIGSANYDIGHVVSTGGGGVAGLGVVCNTSNKARGVTGLPSPIGDAFYIDFVAHEMGHQFAGSHTFNGNAGNCSGGNRTASSAYEVGSGSTIQAYAGICGAQNLQPNSDAYFHARSYDQMVAFTTTGSGNCPAPVATGNNPPVIDAGPAFTIPVSTPFELTAASYSDPNGDELTFCWEEFDLGAAGAGTTDDGSAPILRSFNPSTSPTRVFPKISSLVWNAFPYGEVLPTTNRTMTFRCTARDNRAGGGGVDWDTTTVTSSTSAGPFSVTAPNAATTFAGGSAQTVSWNVANTNAAPVNTANVSIFLSLDGGNSFPICLFANTPNDGTEQITIPNVATSMARIKVKGAGNIFFDISNANFTITAGANGGDSAGIWFADSSANFLRNSNSGGAAEVIFGYGAAPSTLVPLVGDWDGNHTDTAGLYDPSTGFFLLRNSNTGGGADLIFSFGPGGAGIIPIKGDWEGDGIDSVGFYVASTGSFFLKNSSAIGPPVLVFNFGPGGAFLPLAGDWNGDKNTNAGGGADVIFGFGAPGATPITGDWDAL
ncbi:MAG: hypothetical protein IPF53_13590 [Blastocatellia bacterium]|nr:hypothetical protein [Blastocatellia bacterium]